jgi:8-oxo-dGTP pyrophosphatase MutT (NUDIX family)
MLSKLERISSEIHFRNPYWVYRYDNYTMPDGNIGEYHFVETNGSTMIIPQKNHNTFVFIRQYRYLNQRESIEFPGGGIKLKNSPIENAMEELVEETGYKAMKMEEIGMFNPFNGVTNEICHVFLTDELRKEHASPDQSEEFELLELEKEIIFKYIQSGEIWDGMTLASWMLYLSKNP